jgi:hypothetical protein
MATNSDARWRVLSPTQMLLVSLTRKVASCNVIITFVTCAMTGRASNTQAAKAARRKEATFGADDDDWYVLGA